MNEALLLGSCSRTQLKLLTPNTITRKKTYYHAKLNSIQELRKLLPFAEIFGLLRLPGSIGPS